MLSSARLRQIAQRTGTTLPHSIVPAHEPLAGEIRWCDFSMDGTCSGLDTIKKRPVLILGMAASSPAYRLVPLVHVAPLTTQIKNHSTRQNIWMNGKPGQIDVSGMTTVPVRKLSEMANGRLTANEMIRFQALVRAAMGIDTFVHKNAVLARGKVYKILGYDNLFKGAEGLAVIAGRSTYSDEVSTHAVPLTSSPTQGNIETVVQDVAYRIDPAQLRRINGHMLDQKPLGALSSLGMARLDAVLSRNLGIG